MPGAIPHPRRALNRAISWHTLASVCRHHPDLDLRIMETHPGGGLYDCLALALLPSLASLCTFNLGGTSLLMGKPLGPRRSGRTYCDTPGEGIWRYALTGLGEDREELARDIEAWLGLPERGASEPARTAAALALAVVGELLDRVALGSRHVDLRNGWFDTSGDEGSEVRAWATALPALQGQVLTTWEASAMAASRYWALDREHAPKEPAVIVDVVGADLWLRGRAAVSLVDRYKHGAGVLELAWKIEEALDKRG